MEKSDAPLSSPNGTPTSRRQGMRFSPPPGLVCTISGTTARFIVRDLSEGGLALWSDRPLTRGWVHDITLKLGDLMVVTRGRAAHCKKLDDGRWLVGVSFVQEQTKEPTVEQLIDVIAASTLRFS